MNDVYQLMCSHICDVAALPREGEGGRRMVRTIDLSPLEPAIFARTFIHLNVLYVWMTVGYVNKCHLSLVCQCLFTAEVFMAARNWVTPAAEPK